MKELERSLQPEQIKLASSTGEERDYVQIGQVRSYSAGEDAAFHVYEDDYGYSLPFLDVTSLEET